MTVIPEKALDKHVALLGMSGAGKTSVIKSAIVEPDLEADRRVLIITPKDDWWGLRLSRTGKSTAYDIPIFGGRHADYPLNVKDAALLAEAYGTMKGAAIFCTSLLSVQDRARWFAAFAETLLSKNRGWVRVVIDEAHVFMPKQGGKGGGAIPMALHAGNELVSQGRSGGLRIVLASQRSAKLHNDSLTQCSCLIAMLLMAPHDRDAVKDWIEDQADPVKGKEIIASLANLLPGQAWVWAPLAKMLENIQFKLPATFDSSKAPDDDSPDAVVLKPVNLNALQGKLARIEDEKKATDPVALRKEATDLRKENADLKQKIADASTVADPAALEEAQKKGFDQAKKKLETSMQRELKKGYKAALTATRVILLECMDKIDAELRELSEQIPKIETPVFEPPKAPPIMSRPAPSAPRQTSSGATPIAQNGSGALDRPLQRIVDAIKWWNVIHIQKPSHAQVAFVAGYSHKSGTWSTYLSRLRSGEYIEGRGDLVLTDAGRAVANDPATPPDGDQLRATVLQKIDTPLRKILTPILAAYPGGVTHESAGQASGYSHASGTWSTYLSRLRSLDLIEGRGELKASDWLFPF